MTEAMVTEFPEELTSTDAGRRRRTLNRLKVRATRARQSGVADADNAALRIVRMAVPPRKKGRRTLEARGLISALQGRVQKRAMYTLDLLLESSGKDVRDVALADVDACVRGRAPAIEAVLRSNIRLCYDHLIAQGLAASNPSPLVKRRRQALSPQAEEDLQLLEKLHDEMRSARSTRRESRDSLNAVTRWTKSAGLEDPDLDDLLWNDPVRLKELAFWWARPRADGTLRSELCMSDLFKFLLRLWRAHGRSLIDGRDRIRVLKRGLRSSGDDFGPLDLLDLRSQDPAPAPAPERCTKLAQWYASEARRRRALGPDSHEDLIALQRERLAFTGFWKVGARLSSLASYRWDQLKRDDEGMWYFDWCVTKRTRAPKRVVVQTWRVGDTTFSRWYQPQEFIDVAIEALRDEGFDLERYLETRDETAVPWDTARDATFGAHFRGKRISPVWRGKRGHLSVGAVSGIAAHLLRDRLGMDRGAAHALRRRSIMDHNALARRFPQAAQALQHLTPETRAIYEWSEERSVRHMFDAPEAAPAIELPAVTADEASKKPGRRSRLRRAPELSIDDLR